MILKQQKEIYEEYGISMNVYGQITHGGAFITNIVPHSALKNREKEFGIQTKYDSKLVEQIKSSLNEGAFLFTKEHVRNVLKKYYLEEMIDIRKEDFYWERKPSLFDKLVNFYQKNSGGIDSIFHKIFTRFIS